MTAQAAEPLWTLVPAPGSNPVQTVPANGTATVQYVVQNQSGKPKTLVIQSTPGISQTAPCQLMPRGQAGSSCVLNLAIIGTVLPQGGVHYGPVLCQANLDGSPNPNQCYQPGAATSLHITRGPATGATITVSPSALNFVAGTNGLVTVTNSLTSPEPANNVVATIPFGSPISVQSTTCGASLAIGASCTITFASGVQEGPISISIAGDNTNTVNVDVTVTSLPQINITNPVQQDRVITVAGMTPLSLEVTNDAGSVVNANAITVSDKTGCTNLSVDDSNCASVAPGASCTLELTSNTPYVPCTITVSGSNTANSPQALIAFSHLGGLVFAESGGSGKVVIDAAQGFNSLWTNTFSDISGATSLDDGVANTNAIILDGACTGSLANCAAQRCRDISADWYLPAQNELSAVHDALCSNRVTPCNFGGFPSAFYWSSSQYLTNFARVVTFPLGSDDIAVFKNNERPVRCVRAFTP